MATDSGDTKADASFSWLKPHAIFCIILVGEEEIPFGIQKDFLCAKSTFYRSHFAQQTAEQLESLVKLPQATPEVFGLVQHFLYTGALFFDPQSVPSYEVLIATWKLGHELGIEGLCDEALHAMTEARRLSQLIPSTPLLVRAWKETPEGSSIRTLLLTWAAEYINTSESRHEFSKSLPQEVLSELVVAMSNLNSAPVIQVNSVASPGGQSHRKNVHYLERDDSEPEVHVKAPKHRHSDVGSGRSAQNDRKPPKKAVSRPSLPKAPKAKRTSINVADPGTYTAEQRVAYADSQLTKMLSGPGYWTRLVGPFREAVKPVEEGVPDYLEKITKPMDLLTIRSKIDNKEYGDIDEFIADVSLIWENAFTYWRKEEDPVRRIAVNFKKSFEDSMTPAKINKFCSKYAGEEPEE
ncbi:Uu.00g049780.m01.CDS01 [Anthostomella pinea]|uniref:Uu.00g049780.m01.CDS01 n=1 Tax=Anthostomella pinea TaxID=933095 RepID=A0AAI8YET6_9PEZI|nr:Uu.00g049780.m01.CDS01 [Anthostomella pinea]